MNEQQNTLWNKIKHFEIDDPKADFTFSDRLARENGWSKEFTLRVIHEYKKFIFLICITDQSLTPSDEVDQAWHLHLIYTRSYWIDFCENLLKKQIHHGPTAGGESEKSKYYDLYNKTKEQYFETFGYHPPEDIWPSGENRFKNINYTRINRHQYFAIRKLKFFKIWKCLRD